MLASGERLVAYSFEGYWKDVGTIDSLWEANMDLLDPKVPMDLYDPSWKIYSRNPCMPPHYIAAGATVQNSMVSEGCEIAGQVDFSILFAGVHVAKGAVVDSSILMPGAVVEEGAVVTYSVLMPGAVVKKGARVEYAILGENSKVCKNAVVGGAYAPGEEMLISVTSKGAVVEENAVLRPGDMM